MATISKLYSDLSDNMVVSHPECSEPLCTMDMSRDHRLSAIKKNSWVIPTVIIKHEHENFQMYSMCTLSTYIGLFT